MDSVTASTPRKRMTPTSLFPKTRSETPVVYGVEPEFRDIAGLSLASGRFFTAQENEQRSPVCVLGEGAKANLFPQKAAVGESIKIQEQWFRIVGVLGSRLTAQSEVSGLKPQDMNNLIYMPINSMVYRLEDNRSYLKDEIDGVYLQLDKGGDIGVAADMVRGILNASHRNATDYTLVVPAELLAEQKRTQRIFEMVMVAIASRDRRPARRRRETERRAAPVSRGGDSDLFCRGAARDRLRLRPVAPGGHNGRLVDDRDPEFDSAGVRGFRFSRSDLRDLSRGQGRASRSGRSAPSRRLMWFRLRRTCSNCPRPPVPPRPAVRCAAS